MPNLRRTGKGCKRRGGGNEAGKNIHNSFMFRGEAEKDRKLEGENAGENAGKDGGQKQAGERRRGWRQMDDE